MTTSRSVQKELESLREEIAGLRRDYERLNGHTGETKFDATDRFGTIKQDLADTIDAIRESVTESSGAATDEISAHLNELRDVVNEYSDKTEKTVTAHPLATLAGALALGYLIGRFRR